jgi:hypothetical protein
VFALYVASYTVGRFWIESLRIDEAHHFLGMRLNDWTAIIVFLGAVAYFVWSRNRFPGREASPYLADGGAAPLAEGAENADDAEGAERADDTEIAERAESPVDIKDIEDTHPADGETVGEDTAEPEKLEVDSPPASALTSDHLIPDEDEPGDTDVAEVPAQESSETVKAEEPSSKP